MRMIFINRARKKLQFQLVLWASSSQISLARDNYVSLNGYLAQQENVLAPGYRTGLFRALINSTTRCRIQTLRLWGGGEGGWKTRSRNRGAPLDTPLLPTPLLE